jgi:hypothetical protein
LILRWLVVPILIRLDLESPVSDYHIPVEIGDAPGAGCTAVTKSGLAAALCHDQIAELIPGLHFATQPTEQCREAPESQLSSYFVTALP